jgi:hypothetical protein
MLKQEVLALLKSPDFERKLAMLEKAPFHKVLRSLFSALVDEDEEIKWHAVTAVGKLVAARSERDMEGARDVLRRMMWSLNGESGGIGWGIPEAMGEILARSEALAREFARILLSYIQPGGNFLDFELLRRGALWAIGRLGEVHPELLPSPETARSLMPYLDSSDPYSRGYAARALSLIEGKKRLSRLENLLHDETEIRLYQGQKFRIIRIRELAMASGTLGPAKKA